MVSEIQGKILAMISKSDGMRYSEAYPGEDIDDDLYNYHLRQLVKNGLLEKDDKVYRLTDRGKEELVYLDSEGNEMQKFKMVVLMVVTRNNLSEILIHKRNKSPHRGEISTLSGKARLGEEFAETAGKVLKEKVGLEAEFTHWGDYREVRKTTDGKLFEDMVLCICVATDPTGELITKNDLGENWWISFDEIYDYLPNNPTASKKMIDILKRIQKGEKEGGKIETEEVILSKY